MKFRSILTSVWVVLFCVSLSNADDSNDIAQRQKELESVTNAIQSLQKDLQSQLSETNAQRKALKSVEREIGEVQKNLRFLTNEIENQQQRINVLSEQQADLEDRLNAKADDINAILRLAYKQNNQPLIKLLLSGNRPEDLSRHLYYFSVLTQNQQTQLDAWVTEQTLLAESKKQQEQILVNLKANQVEVIDQEKSLRTQKNKRAQVVANLEAQSQTTEQQIAEKQEEYEKLQLLIKELTARLETLSLEFPGLESIAKAKGKLPWPVDGKLTNRYGRTIDRSGLKWEGWLISATEGAPVRAVHGGRVVFADFFKSHGLLLILDHGDGIWTLYGRNQSLLKDVGSWVEAGDVIAEVGQSGGYSESTLYFEVRKNGEPQNPASWLANR